MPLPIDLVFAKICPLLDVQSLGRLMKVDMLYFETFITDAAWQHLHDRFVAAMPDLQRYLFDVYPWNESVDTSDKKRVKLAKNKGACKKKVYTMPRGGYYYCFRTFLMPMNSMNGLKALCTRSTRPMFKGRDIGDWTKRDRTVYHLLRIVMQFVLPPELELVFRSCWVQHNGRWFTITFYNRKADFVIALTHGETRCFYFSQAGVYDTNFFAIMREYRRLINPKYFRYIPQTATQQNFESCIRHYLN